MGSTHGNKYVSHSVWQHSGDKLLQSQAKGVNSIVYRYTSVNIERKNFDIRFSFLQLVLTDKPGFKKKTTIPPHTYNYITLRMRVLQSENTMEIRIVDTSKGKPATQLAGHLGQTNEGEQNLENVALY